MLEEIPTSGLYEMYGEHIRLCIRDYVVGFRLFNNMSKKKRKQITSNNQIKANAYRNFITSKAYIFDGLLEESIMKFGLPLEPEFVKKYALKVAKGDYKFTNRKTLQKGRIDEIMCPMWGSDNSQ
jgi:hypothetical protein